MRRSPENPAQDPVFDPASLDLRAQTRDPNQDPVKMRV
jgi:hypothetical protein